MNFKFIANFPLWLLFIIIFSGAVVVWISGGKLSHYAGIVAKRSGFGQAMIGAVLLGGITSLPEVATTLTASFIGSAPIAVNNIIGGVSMQVAVLAVADTFVSKRALSFYIDDERVKLQAVFNILMLTVVLTGILFPGVFSRLPVWTGLILILYAISLLLMKSIEVPLINKEPDVKNSNSNSISNLKLSGYTIVNSIIILVAGFAISISGENIAQRTVFGENYVGAVLIAATTSLPELSTTIAAVKEKKYNMAASNIFGSNLIILALLFIADITFKNGTVLTHVKEFSQFGVLLGIFMCSVYLIGFATKKKKAVLNMGIDSALVLILYLSGLVILYFLK